MVGTKVGASVKGADSGDDGIEFRKIGADKIVGREQRYLATDLAERSRDFIAGSGDVADIFRKRPDACADQLRIGAREQRLGRDVRILNHFGGGGNLAISHRRDGADLAAGVG